MPMPRMPMSVMAYSQQQQQTFGQQSHSLQAMMAQGPGAPTLPAGHSSPVHRPVTPPSLPFAHEQAAQR